MLVAGTLSLRDSNFKWILYLWFSCKTNQPVLSQCSEGPGCAPMLHQCLAPPPNQKWTSAGCLTPLSALWWWLLLGGSVERPGNKRELCLSTCTPLLMSRKKHVNIFLSRFPSRLFPSRTTTVVVLESILMPQYYLQIYTHSEFEWLVRKYVLLPAFMGLFSHYTCSGSLSCSRLLCLRVVWRILTSSTGLQDNSRGISSISLSTKLSCMWGSSDRNSLRVAENIKWRNRERRVFRDYGSLPGKSTLSAITLLPPV